MNGFKTFLYNDTNKTQEMNQHGIAVL